MTNNLLIFPSYLGEQLEGPLLVLLHKVPVQVQAGETKLPAGALLISGQSQPVEGYLIVLGCPMAVGVHVAQVSHGLVIPLLGRALKVVKGL